MYTNIRKRALKKEGRAEVILFWLILEETGG
jgi:hypothetical protein